MRRFKWMAIDRVLDLTGPGRWIGIRRWAGAACFTGKSRWVGIRRWAGAACFTGKSRWVGIRRWAGAAFMICAVCLPACLYAQVRPTSTFLLDDDLTERMIPSDSTELQTGPWAVVLSGFAEIPFGLPELQLSWLEVRLKGPARTIGVWLSRTGFDQLSLTGFELFVRQKVNKTHSVQLDVGALRALKGALGTAYEAQWSVEAVVIKNPVLAVLGGVGRQSGLGKRGIGPSELTIRSRAHLTKSVSFYAKIISSAVHSLRIETAIGYEPMPFIQLDVGFESSRSMMIVDLKHESRLLQVVVYLSHHPVLGRSLGSSVRWYL